MKIRLVGAEFLQEDGWIDRHDEANSRFPVFCQKQLKTNQHKLLFFLPTIRSSFGSRGNNILFRARVAVR